MTVDRLTERQKECLRLVLTLGETKAIARALGISPNVVSKHIEEAMRRLGVGTRAQAALLLAQHEGGGENPPPEPRPLSYGLPIAATSASDPLRSQSDGPGVGVLREGQSIYVPGIGEPPRLAHLLGGIRPGDLSAGQRIVIMLIIAVLLAIGFGVLFIGLDALWRFGHSLRTR